LADIETSATPSLEIGGEGASTSASFGHDGKPTVTEGTDTTVFDSGNPKPELEIEDGIEDADDEKDPSEGSEEDEGDKKDDEAGDDESASELPDFDAGSEEVLKAYDAKYTHEDGTLNLDAFNQSVQSSYDKTGKADITPNERAYVKAAFGVSDKAIDTHLAGLEAQAELADQKFYASAGGKDAYESMLDWARGDEASGRAGGYTPAQRERFNKAIQAGGDDLAEQLELLKNRFAASGGKVAASTESPSVRFRDRRKASPERVAQGSGTGSPGVKPFETEADFRAAQKEAGEDNAKHAEVRKRLQASKWFRAGKA